MSAVFVDLKEYNRNEKVKQLAVQSCISNCGQDELLHV